MTTEPLSSRTGTKPQSILVIEDDRGTQDLICALLESFAPGQYDVRCAGDGAQGIAMLKATAPAAIILDLLLPHINGFEVLRELRAHNRELLSRCIVITGASTATIEHFADASHVAKVLIKPFDVFELLHSVVNAVQHSH